MIKPDQQKPSGTLKEQAGYWVLQQHSGQWTKAHQHELQAWLALSAAHQAEYARALAIWQRLGQFKSASFPVRQAAQQQRSKLLRRRQQLKASVRLAGAATLTVLLAVAVNGQLSTTRYRTDKGQQQTVTLADGSQINLNTDTELLVTLTDQHRRVSLRHGEAFFTVVHDENRPFEVIAASGRIRDVGTRFNINSTADHTQVTVAEGEIEIITDKATLPEYGPPGFWWSAIFSQWLPLKHPETHLAVRVTAGQQLSYNSLGEWVGLSKPNTSQITAWREGRLVFELATLAEVTNQLARYHPVAFEFANPQLKQLKVSASFNIGNLPLILNTLQATFPIKVQWLDGQHARIVAAKH